MLPVVFCCGSGRAGSELSAISTLSVIYFSAGRKRDEK